MVNGIVFLQEYQIKAKYNMSCSHLMLGLKPKALFILVYTLYHKATAPTLKLLTTQGTQCSQLYTIKYDIKHTISFERRCYILVRQITFKLF